MKALFLVLAAAFSLSAFANSDCHTGHSNGDCNDDKYFTCFVHDGDGVTYKKNSDWNSAEYLVQYRVMKLCRAESRHPKTCRPLGCDYWYN